MEAKVLADALVEAGILEWFETVDGHDGSLVILPYVGLMPTEDAITDWRVAGKVLELCGESHLFWDDVDFGCTLCVGIGIPKGKGSVDGYHRLGLPRAIIEAWYQALQGDSDE